MTSNGPMMGHINLFDLGLNGELEQLILIYM